MTENIRKLVLLGAIGVLVISIVALSGFNFSQAALQNTGKGGQQERYHERFSAKRAFAEVGRVDEKTGIHTDVLIEAGDSYRHGQDGDSYSFAFVQISRYTLGEQCEDYDGQTICDYVQSPILVIYGETELQDSDFRASNSLRTASLVTQLTGFDYVSGEEKIVSIDAKWTGVGDVFRGRDRIVEDNNFYRYTENSMGASRDANVLINVTGDVAFNLEGRSHQEDDEEYGEARIGKYTAGESEFIKKGY